MAVPNPAHQDFISNVATKCAAGVKALNDAFADAQTYSLLGYAANGADAIVDGDFVNANAGLTAADLAAAVAAMVAIQGVLTANNNAGLIALLKLAQRG